MKTALLGVLGLVAIAACGGSDGDADSGDSKVTLSKTGQPDGVDPLQLGVRKSGQLDGGGDRYEYVLHGSDADVDAWLVASDIVAERSQAGGLTYAVVRTTHARQVPATLQP